MLDDIADFEDDDKRFEVEPYSGSSYAEVPTDAVLYIDFTGSDIKKGVVPVAKELIQHFLDATNPKFPITNQPVSAQSSLFQRFSAWFLASLEGNARPFKYAQPVIMEDFYNPEMAADIQQKAITYFINVQGRSEDELIEAGIPEESVLLYLVNAYAQDPAREKLRRPVRMMKKGARLSARSLSNSNIAAYTSILRESNERVILPYFSQFPREVDDGDVDYEEMREAFRTGDLRLMRRSISNYMFNGGTLDAVVFLENGVAIDANLRGLLRMEVQGFSEVLVLVEKLIELGVRVVLDQPDDFDLMPAYAAHCKLYDIDRMIAPSDLLEKEPNYIRDALESGSKLRLEEVLCVMRGLPFAKYLSVVDDYNLPISTALALTLRYGDSTLADALYNRGFRPEKRLLDSLHHESPGAAIYSDLGVDESAVRGDFYGGLTAEEAVIRIRTLESSASDRMTAPSYYINTPQTSRLFDLVVNGRVLDDDAVSGNIPLDFHYHIDDETLLTYLASVKPVNYESNIRSLLVHGANPWGMNIGGRSFARIICDDPETFRDAINCILEMEDQTRAIRRQLFDGFELDLQEATRYDVLGHYVWPPLIFMAIKRNNRTLCFHIARRSGDFVRMYGMTPLQYAKKLNSPLVNELGVTAGITAATFNYAAGTGHYVRAKTIIWSGADLDRRALDLRSFDWHILALLAEAGYFRFARDFRHPPLTYALNQNASVPVLRTLVRSGCNPFVSYTGIGETPSFNAESQRSVGYMQQLVRQRMDRMRPSVARKLQFVDVSVQEDGEASFYHTLERISVDELRQRLQYWKLPSTQLDVVLRNPGENYDIPMLEVDRELHRHLVDLGGFAFTEDTSIPSGWIRGGCRLMLENHYVTPVHVALYNLRFALDEDNLRRNINMWEHVYPVPYPVLGWISAALRFDPSLAHIKDVFPQLLFFFARNPAVTARLTWNMTLIAFSKAAVEARRRGRLHPRLFSVMDELRHPLAYLRGRVFDDDKMRGGDFLTADEKETLTFIIETNSPFTLEKPPSFADAVFALDHATLRDEIKRAAFIQEIGDYVRWLLLLPRTAHVEARAAGLFRMLVLVHSDFFDRQAMALIVAGLVPLRETFVRKWWKRKFENEDDFFSSEHVVGYHSWLLASTTMLGGVAMCAVYDCLYLTDFSLEEKGPRAFFDGRACNKRMRRLLLKYDRSVRGEGEEIVFRKAPSLENPQKTGELNRVPIATLSRWAFVSQIGFDYVMPDRADNVFCHNAVVERQVEDLISNTTPSDTLLKAWAIRFLITLERRIYGNGLHLQLISRHYRHLFTSTLFVLKASTRTPRAAFELLVDRDVKYDSRACDGLSLFSGICEHGFFPNLDELVALLGAAVLRGFSLLDPVIDGRPFAFLLAAPSPFEMLRSPLTPAGVAALAPGINRLHPEYDRVRDILNREGISVPPSPQEAADRELAPQRIVL